MPPVPKYTRRWFQFSMGTMFVVVTLLAALGVWIANSFHWIQERREILALAMTLDDGTGLTVTGYSMTKRDGLPKAPFSLRILGESGCDKLQIAFPRKSREGALSTEQQRELVRIERLFPEATEIRWGFRSS